MNELTYAGPRADHGNTVGGIISRKLYIVATISDDKYAAMPRKELFKRQRQLTTDCSRRCRTGTSARTQTRSIIASGRHE